MNCENARLYYYDYLEKIEAVPSDIKEHLEQCSVCRNEIELLKQILNEAKPAEKPYRPKYLQLHYELVDRWVSCEMVRPFLPSLLISELGTRYQTPVTAHVENCPECRQSVRQIASLKLTSSDLVKAAHYLADDNSQEVDFTAYAHSVLEKVKHSESSGILTRVRLKQADNDEHEWVADSVIVDVEHRGAETRPHHRENPKRHQWAWAASGIAAAIIFAVLVVLPMENIKALDAAQLYATLETVQNVHIQKFDGSRELELENIWIAEGAGLFLIQRDQNTVLVNTRSGKIFQKHEGLTELTSQQSQMQLQRPWGLLPFKHISELPTSYNWEFVSDGELEGGLKVHIYEWSWKETLRNQTEIERTWRGYLDARSHLPYRIEWLDKIGNAPAQLIVEMKITYPSDSECVEVFKSYGFEELTYGDQDELLRRLPLASKVASTEDGFFLSTCPSTNAALIFPDE